jgi:hypothetical protein
LRLQPQNQDGDIYINEPIMNGVNGRVRQNSMA